MRAEFKFVGIDLSGEPIVTRRYVAITGADAAERVEEHAAWVSRWTRDDPPRLLSLELEDYERSAADAERPLFSDCTESVLGHRIAEDELLNRAGEPSLAAAWLRSRLLAWVERGKALETGAEVTDLDEDTRRRLEALGYLD